MGLHDFRVPGAGLVHVVGHGATMIKAGRYYFRRDGRIVGPAVAIKGGKWFVGGEVYPDNGRVSDDFDGRDLVEVATPEFPIISPGPHNVENEYTTPKVASGGR